MTESRKTWVGIAVPRGWDDVLVRTVTAALVAFVSLLLKEWLDSREWDAPACAIDGTWVAGGTFVLNAILRWAAPSAA